MTGPEIPANGDAITADWMQRALRAGGALDVPVSEDVVIGVSDGMRPLLSPNAPVIQDVVVEDIGAGVGLMAEILRCRLTCAGGAAAVPASVIVKLHSREPKSRRMSRLQSLYQREYAFYREVAPGAPIRSPRLLYGDFEASSDRFVLVLEDLGSLHTGDQLAGATASEARRAVRAIARLHGHNWDRVGRPPLSGFYDVGSPRNRPWVQGIYLAFLVPALKHFGSFFSAEMRDLAEEYGPRAADHLADVAATPQTFIHGDFRLDNLFFDSGDEQEVVVVDWQVSGLGSGLYDVAYFLGGSVSSSVRHEIERDLVGEYTDIVCSMGAKGFTYDDCWRLYRQNMLGCFLITIIVCGGLDLNDDRSRRLADIAVPRALAAIEDLDAREFLPARRPPLSAANIFSNLSRLAYRGYRALR